MTRVVEKTAPKFGKKVKVCIVVTKTLVGAKRYMALVQKAGRRLPVPSIIINEQLAFGTTPDVETLWDHLEKMVARQQQTAKIKEQVHHGESQC